MVLSLATFSASAVAAESKTVVLVVDADAPAVSSWPEAERRLEAELEAVGLDVVRVPSPNLDRVGAVSEQELSSLAELYRAIGALRLARDTTGGHIYLYVTGETTLRLIEVPLRQLEQPSGAAAAVLGAVELLHEAGLNISLPSEPERELGETPSDSAESNRVTPEDSRREVPRGGPRGGYFTSNDVGLYAVVGTGLSTGTADPRPMLITDLALGWASDGVLSAEVQGSLTPVGRDTNGGRLRYFASRLLGVIDLSNSSNLMPSFALGPSLLVAWTAFHGTSRGEGDDSDVLLGATAQLRVAYAMNDAAALRFGLGLLWTARTLRTDRRVRSLSTGEQLDLGSSLSHTPIADTFVQLVFR